MTILSSMLDIWLASEYPSAFWRAPTFTEYFGEDSVSKDLKYYSFGDFTVCCIATWLELEHRKATNCIVSYMTKWQWVI